MNWLIRRASEPSTWAGLAAVVFGGSGLTGTPLQTLTPDLVVNAVVALAGLVAVFKRQSVPTLAQVEQATAQKGNVL